MDRKQRDLMEHILEKIRHACCCMFSPMGIHEKCQMADLITEMETGIQEYDEDRV